MREFSEEKLIKFANDHISLNEGIYLRPFSLMSDVKEFSNKPICAFVGTNPATTIADSELPENEYLELLLNGKIDEYINEKRGKSSTSSLAIKDFIVRYLGDNYANVRLNVYSFPTKKKSELTRDKKDRYYCLKDTLDCFKPKLIIAHGNDACKAINNCLIEQDKCKLDKKGFQGQKTLLLGQDLSFESDIVFVPHFRFYNSIFNQAGMELMRL